MVPSKYLLSEIFTDVNRTQGTIRPLVVNVFNNLLGEYVVEDLPGILASRKDKKMPSKIRLPKVSRSDPSLIVVMLFACVIP